MKRSGTKRTPKIAILVDSLAQQAGVERVILAIAKQFNADIYVGEYRPKKTFPAFRQLRVKQIFRRSIRGLGHFGLRSAFARLRLRGYNAYILHGAASLEAARQHTPNLWYCNAPSRWLYDLYHEELEKRRGLARLAFASVCAWLRYRDQNNVRHVTTIIANSKNVRKRLQRFYKRDAAVIYPPVKTSSLRWRGQGAFYLSPARLDPIKRVDLIVRAFQKLTLPHHKLIITSTGPDHERITRLANHYPNITLRGAVSEEELRRLYGRCIAALSTSYKEDFGLIPVEANAAGKPVIATNSGGYRETVIDGKTGILIDEPVTPDKIVAAVKKMTPSRAARMRKACERNAKRFDLKTFNKQIEHVLAEVLKTQ